MPCKNEGIVADIQLLNSVQNKTLSALWSSIFDLEILFIKMYK